MFTNILLPKQQVLKPLLRSFADEYCLVGGTAIALQIGHRRSVDFDLFTGKEIMRKSIKRIIEESQWPIQEIIYEAYDQMHLVVNDVKMTFFSYPFLLSREVDWTDTIRMPNLLDLAAMKAHALGGRAKWRDYVDLYFMLKDHCALDNIVKRAKEMYQEFFSEKLFREQLAYFEDVDYSEDVVYMKDSVPKEMIKSFLIDAATQSM